MSVQNRRFTSCLVFGVVGIVLALWAPSFGGTVLWAQVPIAAPADVGMDPAALSRIPTLVREALGEKKMPGAVVCVGRRGKIVYLEAFGHRKLSSEPELMTVDTIFDMASITKPVATATCVMKLVERGSFRLEDKVAKYLPDFAVHGKDAITVKHLLLHQSGLIPDNPLSDYLHGPTIAWKNVCALKLMAPVGTEFKYSDVNFIVLAKLIERVADADVHAFSQREIFAPLGMRESGFLPSESLKARAAVTEQRDGEWMRGEVHDPRAYHLGGVAGHAGLFSSATDLAIYAQMLLNEGTYDLGEQPIKVLSPRTVRIMTRGYAVSSGIRGLGWDKQTGYSSNRGDLLTKSAFGHGGFTGTVLWIDPKLDLFFIFLSNRVHPDGQGSVNHLAGQLLNVIAGAINARD